MSEAAVFKGTFSDFRIVKGRKVVQILVEVPSELANAALGALGGIPDPANPVWVAVARIDPKAAKEPRQLPAPEKERKKWEEMPPSQQAAIRCGEALFRQFLSEKFCAPQGWPAPTDEQEAASVVRTVFKIDSRRELNDPPVRMKWVHFDNEYYAWQRGYH